MSNPFDDAVLEVLTGKSTSASPQPVDGNQLLHDISSFIGRYLYCSQHQRTILALWVLHTYCYSGAQLTPYLSIQSAEKQSGKTLCLQLLQLLCDFATLTAGVTASSLRRLMEGVTPTVLLDECQASVGTRSRSKAPTLRAMLVRGTHPDPDGIAMIRDCKTFGPKAFAGRGQLPEDLADHSIPIILHPLNACVAQRGKPQKNTTGPQPPPAAFCPDLSLNCRETETISNIVVQPQGSPTHAGVAYGGVEVPSAARVGTDSLSSPERLIYRFHLRSVTEEAKPLRKRLRDWHTLHRAALQEMPPCLDDQYPSDLSYRQQDLCEPLLDLAQLIGGDWPARIREALSVAFTEQTKFDLHANIQLLADIRDCFAYHGYPQRLSTANFVDWIHSLPARPWDIDGRFSAHMLARLLAPFDIHPRMQRMNQDNANAEGKGKGEGKDNSGLRGYQLQAFQESWKEHLDFDAPQSAVADEACVAQPGSPTRAGVACDGVEVPSAVSGSKIGISLDRDCLRLCSSESAENCNIAEAPQSEIANNDRVCCGVAVDAMASDNPVTRYTDAPISAQPLPSSYPLTNLPSYQLKPSESAGEILKRREGSY